jgi:hypothetical protein
VVEGFDKAKIAAKFRGRSPDLRRTGC